MQNRCVSEEVLSICLANHSFINEILFKERLVSPTRIPIKFTSDITRNHYYTLLYSPILRVIRSIQGACVWIQNFTELLMNISCSKFPQKLYNYNLHSIVLPLTHFLTIKKNWSLFLIHQADWSQSKCYDDLAYSHSYRNVQEKVLRLQNNDGDFWCKLSPRAKSSAVSLDRYLWDVQV